jgi:hypothetical protein
MILRALVLLLVLVSAASGQTVNSIIGFETGDANEIVTLGASAAIVTSPVITGAYSLQQAATQSTLTQGLSATQIGVRWQMQDPTPTTAITNLLTIEGAGGVDLNVITAVTGVIKISGGTQCASIAATLGSTQIGTGTRTFQLVLDQAAGGVAKLWMDGNLEINITHSLACTDTTFQTVKVVGLASPNQLIFDDFLIQSGSTAQPPAGHELTRQGTTGTPTDNAWGTKTCASCSGSTCAGSCATGTSCCAWSETPFGTAKLCSTTTANAQGVLVAPFNATQTGHGSETIGSSDTVNACKVVTVAKVSNAATTGMSIRRRLNGANTDTVQSSFSTSDKFFTDCCWTPGTTTFLNSAEMGLTITSGTRTWTAEELWMMCDVQTTTTTTTTATTTTTTTLATGGGFGVIYLSYDLPGCGCNEGESCCDRP